MPARALMPRDPVPALNVALTTGGRFVLGANPGEHFDLVVFYRGLHCPICAKYLIELERLAPEFAARGVQLLAVSSDDMERAGQMADKVKRQKPQVRLWPESEKCAPVGAVHQRRSRQNIHRHRRTRAVQRAGCLYRAPGWHALLRRGANHAVCPAAISGFARCH